MRAQLVITLSKCLDQWLNSAGTGRNGVPPPQIAVPPSKVVVPLPGNDVPSPFWGNH